MKHSQKLAVEYWDNLAKNNPDEKSSKVNPRNDYTSLDAQFIVGYANSESEILDLASGTGQAINKYHAQVGSIDAVEKFSNFSKFINKSPNIRVFNEDVVDFVPDKDYDLILMFGLVQYFNEDEIKTLYAYYRNYLKPEGKLIVKNQFGVDSDVTVGGVSEELGVPYYSEYRHIKKEENIIRSVGYAATEVVEIYPPEASRWVDTHFYAIIANK